MKLRIFVKKKGEMMEKKKSRPLQEWIDILNSNIPIPELNTIERYSKQLPINILDLSKALGVSVYRPYIETNLEGWIEHDNEEKLFKIYLNTQYPAKKQRFTLAHELSHFLLHKNEIIEEGQLDRAYQVTGYFDKKEFQANLYASELLIPTDLIHEIIENQPKYLEDKDSFEKYLIKHCDVSKPVASKRASRAIKHFKQMNL